MFTRFNIITITTSNTRAFKEVLCPLSVLPNSTGSWRMRVIYIYTHTHEKGLLNFWGARYRLGARYLSKNTVII
jgi:hypothetical protein